MTARDLLTLARDLTAYNTGIARSRADYERYPNTACIFKDCEHLADDGYMCRTHHGLGRDPAAQRMRDYRRKVSHAAAQARYRARNKETKK